MHCTGNMSNKKSLLYSMIQLMRDDKLAFKYYEVRICWHSEEKHDQLVINFH